MANAKLVKQQSSITLDDLAVMIKQGFDQVDRRFEGVDKRLDNLENDVHDLKIDVSSLKTDVNYLKGEVNHIKNQMVTKDYLDEKLFDLKGELIELIRKQDNKFVTLVQILGNKKILTKKEVRHITALEPFGKS